MTSEAVIASGLERRFGRPCGRLPCSSCSDRRGLAVHQGASRRTMRRTEGRARWPGGPRHTPSTGVSSLRRSAFTAASSETPAVVGIDRGPARRSRPSGRRSTRSVELHSRRRCAARPPQRTELAQILDQVVREGVVVVDHREGARSRPSRSPSRAMSMASHQRGAPCCGIPRARARGSESATIPAPACSVDLASSVARAMVRMVMAVIHVARVVHVADAAAVGAAPHRLELVDDLHGAHLGRARERARREGRAQYVEPVEAVAELPLHVRNDVHHVRVALHRRRTR